MIGRALIWAVAALSAMPAPAQLTGGVAHHATGSFDVVATPDGQPIAAGDGPPIGRMTLVKTFNGGLQGVSRGQMLTAGAPETGAAAVYVAIDPFDGAVDGRRGGFVLVHRGMIAKAGGTTLDVIILPDSGTGALAGISGRLDIKIEGGKHYYDLSYRLPAR